MNSVSGNNWEEIIISQRIIDKVKSDYNFNEIISKLVISREYDQTEIDLVNNSIGTTYNALNVIYIILSYNTKILR